MTNKEILEKAIQKAIDGGWEEILPNERWKVVTDRGLEIDIEMNSPTGNLIGERKDYMEVIFNHDFAKALWGDSWYSTISHTHHAQIGVEAHKRIRSWQYHLQQMVIAEEPISYLGEHI